MEAKQNSIFKFIQQQDTQFIIPVYQRNYDWKNEQCKQLLYDIIQAGMNKKVESHFVGSIVYLHTGVLITPSKLTIIDGQQRLTTITLIFSALYNRALESGNEKQADSIKRKFLINEDLETTEKIKLRPIKKDDLALTSIINNSLSDFQEFSRIIENYKYFYDNIKADDIETVLFGLQKLVFIEVALEKGKDDPQKIFQSLNSTGLDLSPADLIRNYILMGLNDREQNDIYTKYWKPIEDNCMEIVSKNSRVSDFIRDYLTLKFKKIPNKDKVYEEFKENYIFQNDAQLINVLHDLKNFSEPFSRLINNSKETNLSIRENLYLINKLQINVAYPFLMQVYKDYFDGIIESKLFCDVLELIQSYVWRRFIVGLPTNALNKIFMDLYNYVEKDDYLTSIERVLISKKVSGKFPTNEEVFKELSSKDMYNIQAKNRTYFLERLENHGKREKFVIEGNQDFTIEHIFPQTPTMEWKENLGDDYNEMKSLVNTCANLTLSVFNKELSNYTFDKKRELLEKGYKYSKLGLNRLLSEFEHWNLNSYYLRLEWIKSRFIEIWKYPNLVIDTLDSNEDEIDILDIVPSDVTNRSIDYIKFFEEKHLSLSWQQLYKIVASIMFEREPHMFMATELRDTLKLTQNPEKLLRALQISQSYFIESNLGAQTIVLRIQKILEKCETDDELVIKLKNNGNDII